MKGRNPLRFARGKEFMLTKEQLAVLISKRAMDQFLRDAYRLKIIIAQNDGQLTIEDMQKIIIGESQTKTSFLNKLLKRQNQDVMSEEENDRYYLMQLAFKIMEMKSVTKLSIEDINSRSLRPVYLKCFRKEYEEYEKQEYAFRDVPFQESAISVIMEFKVRKLQMEDELQ